MHDFLGHRVKHALPGEPVEVLGFDSVPDAGEPVRAVVNDREARHLAGERAIRLKTEALARRKAAPVSLEDVFDRVQEGEAVALNIVLKADVAGSLEALQDQLAKVSTSAGRPERAAHRRRRDHPVRRDAGRRFRRGDHRLQRAPAARGEDARRPRGRRDPHLHGDLQDHRGAARGDGGHARARRGRAVARHGRGAPDLPRVADRHDRRVARHPGQDHAQRARAAGARGHHRLRRHDHFAEALQGRCQGSRGRLRVRNRARELQRPQGGDVIEAYETRKVAQTLE